MTSFDEEIANRQAEFHDCFGGQEFLEADLIAATERLWGAAAVIYGDQAGDRAFGTLVGADPQVPHRPVGGVTHWRWKPTGCIRTSRAAWAYRLKGSRHDCAG